MSNVRSSLTRTSGLSGRVSSQLFGVKLCLFVCLSSARQQQQKYFCGILARKRRTNGIIFRHKVAHRPESLFSPPPLHCRCCGKNVHHPRCRMRITYKLHTRISIMIGILPSGGLGCCVLPDVSSYRLCKYIIPLWSGTQYREGGGS